MRALGLGRCSVALAVTMLMGSLAAAFPPAASADVVEAAGLAAPRLPLTAPAVDGLLDGVTATSARNAWAVGNDTNNNTLIEHWNGRKWQSVAVPAPASAELDSVTFTSAANAWAVGDYSSNSLTLHTLIEHWNGKTWKVVAAPSPNEGASLLAVAARSGSTAFAVGGTESNFLYIGSTFLEEWNGHAWRDVSQSTSYNGYLFGVTFVSAKSAWAVGSNVDGPVVIERWNGIGWS